MKPFILKLLSFILLLGLVLLGSLFFIPNNKLPDNSLFASFDKHERLSKTPSPKIILVGGSNWPFGVKSQMIENATGLPVVNMGLHAGLGINYILSEVEDDIKSGDYVVVSMEYHHFVNSSMYQGEDVLAALLFDVNRNCIKYVKPNQWIGFTPNIFLYASKKIINITPQSVDDFENLFTRESFNIYGDETAHYGLPSSVQSGNSAALSQKVYKKSIQRLVKFSKLVKNRGAKLLFVSCPYPEPQYRLDSVAINNIVREVEKNGLNFDINPEECIFPDSLMFNSYFHLTEQGAEARTERLIKLLHESVTGKI